MLFFFFFSSMDKNSILTKNDEVVFGIVGVATSYKISNRLFKLRSYLNMIYLINVYLSDEHLSHAIFINYLVLAIFFLTSLLNLYGYKIKYLNE